VSEATATTPPVDALGIPRHQYTLECQGCSHSWDACCSQFEVFDQQCPSCKATNSRVSRSDLHAGCPSGRQYVGRDWRGMEGISLNLPEVRPEDRAQWKKDVPSVEFDDRGRIKFNNDAHQRQVYREMNRFREAMENPR